MMFLLLFGFVTSTIDKQQQHYHHHHIETIQLHSIQFSKIFIPAD